MAQKSKSTARQYAVNIVGLAMLMVVILLFLGRYLGRVISTFAIAGAPIEEISAPAEWAIQSYAIIMPVLVFMLPYLFLKKLAKPFGLQVSFAKSKVSLWVILPLFLGAVIILNSVVSLLRSLVNLVFGAPAAILPTMPTSGFGILLYFFSSCVIPAIFEELFFRGAVQGILRRWGAIFAISVTSVLFLLMHSNPWDFPTILIASALLGYVAERTGSILPCIILHFANNFSRFFISFLQAQMEQIAAAALLFWVMLALITFIISALFFTRKTGISWRLKKPPFPKKEPAPQHGVWFTYLCNAGYVAVFIYFVLRFIFVYI